MKGPQEHSFSCEVTAHLDTVRMTSGRETEEARENKGNSRSTVLRFREEVNLRAKSPLFVTGSWAEHTHARWADRFEGVKMICFSSIFQFHSELRALVKGEMKAGSVKGWSWERVWNSHFIAWQSSLAGKLDKESGHFDSNTTFASYWLCTCMQNTKSLSGSQFTHKWQGVDEHHSGASTKVWGTLGCPGD